MIDQRSYRLFEELTKRDQTTKQALMRQLSLSERQLTYDIEKVNEVLMHSKLPLIESGQSLIRINPLLKEIPKKELLMNGTSSFAEKDRPYLIYLYTFIRKEPVSNYHFQLLLRVSKNTALADVKKLKEICQEWDILFTYTRMDGYHLRGNELDKRRVAIYCVNHLLSRPLGKEIIDLALKSWEQEEAIANTLLIADDFLDENKIILVKSRKMEMVIHLTFLKLRNQKGNLVFNELEKQLLERQNVFPYGENLAELLLAETQTNERYYVTILLLAALQEVESADHQSLETLAGQIIDEFEKNTLIPVKEKEYLKQSLLDHLVPAFFRITFGLPLVNPLTQMIKEEYSELFQFVKRSLAPLTLWTGKEISEDEIGFFTIHFGGYLENRGRLPDDKIRAVIVCFNGLSSSIMLEAQLKEIFPNIIFSRVRSGEHLESMPVSSYDAIFSTVNVNSVQPVFLVKPLLSQIEKNYLIQSVMHQFPNLREHHFSVDQLMGIIKKHTVISDEDKLFSELVHLMYAQNKGKGMNKPMLSELLTKETIYFTDEDLNWKEAIEKAADPLVEGNLIQNRYVESMIKNVEEIGTYIHIGKGIAIPHARPEDGVNRLAMSFLRTKKPVLLLDQEAHQIDIFICLAAIDSEAHLKALAQLTKILGNNELLSALKEAATAEQVIEIIKKGEMK